MADFRKLFVALIAGALLFGSVASAVDYGCSARAVPTIVRAEAVSDMVGDVVLDCSGTLPLSINPALGITVNIRLQLNTTITSKLLTTPTPYPPVTEGTLILDNAAVLTTGPKGYSSVSGNILTPFTDGSQNVYQAVRISDTELEWQGVVLIGPNSNPGTTTIRLTDVRARAAGMIPAGGTITGTVIITTPTSVTIGNNKMDLAYVRQGMTITYPALVAFNNCDFLLNQNPAQAPFSKTSNIVFTEGFGTAFRPRVNTFGAPLPAVPHNLPGGAYFDESGYNPLWGNSASSISSVPNGTLSGGVLVAPTLIGTATTGTQFAIIVTNIPAGVTVTGGAVVTPTNGLIVSGPVATTSGTTTTLIYEVIGYAGNGTAQFLLDSVIVPVTATLGPPSSVGTMQVHARFNPLAIGATLVGVQDLAPDNDNNPRFLDIFDTLLTPDIFTIQQNCKTLLLFPYLTSQSGYESGIAISNTSDDPITNVLTVAQAGACTLSFFGQQAAARLPLTAGMATQTSVTIPTGGQMTSTVSGGLATGTVYAQDGTQTAACTPTVSNPCTGIPSFQGYMIASCNFQYAHGFSFITDTRSDRTMGYLALVIPYRVVDSLGDISRPPQDNSLGNAPNQGEQLNQ